MEKKIYTAPQVISVQSVRFETTVSSSKACQQPTWTPAYQKHCKKN